MKKVLTKKFFERKSPEVAKDLIGKYLVRKIGDKEIAIMITETEAYNGTCDKACHASKGRTKRTEPLFGEAGIFYVYLIYGFYYLLNVVCDEKDVASAVLIRGLSEVSGPGRLTKHLSIDKTFLGKEAKLQNNLWFEDRGEKINPKQIKKTPRIGVDYSGPVWSKKLYRFLLEEK